ncbi:MAG TPA: carbon-nitrogen hydrolase family protein [Beijerinckiaceae bacterium]|jgi:nitrilase
MKIALIQMNSVSDKAANVAQARDLIARAVDLEGPDWVALPEQFDWAGGTTADKLRESEDLGSGPAYAMAQEMAAKHRIWVHAGSLMERVRGEDKVSNTTVVFDRSGREVARYRKIHLFDITAPDGAVYNESAAVKPGREVVTYECEGLTVGCAICYDLRFPDLFQALAAAGADLIVLPAAFTLQTGKDHWEVLCRARAIETQAYFAAPAQTGSFLAKGERRQTYGHSLIVDPWGHVVAKASDGIGHVTTRLDPALIARVRQQIPLASHKVPGLAVPPRRGEAA